MKRNSLRLRLVAGGIAAIAIALVIAGAGLTLLFERHVARSVADDLDVHLKQLLAGVDVDADGRIVVTRPPPDPRFADPLSGLYWQIGDDRNQLLRSRSLWDTTLSLPSDDPAPGEAHHHELPGPAGARVLVSEQRVIMKIGERQAPVRIAVAVDLARVSAARTAFAADLVLALGVLGVVLAAATSFQVALGLRPLDVLRRGVADIRSGRDRHLIAQVPDEVRPLVDEVNALLDAREQDIVRSRNRAADLAHGLKTPLAALAADGDRLRQKGEVSIADDIEAAIDAMRRHVDRELARARLRGGVSLGHGVTTPVAPLVRSLIATLSRTVAGARMDYETAIADDVVAPFDRADLAEVMGNLLENATRHAKSRIRVGVQSSLGGMAISIEDDGPGIATHLRSTALARGARLDERGEGTGLGLAIVQDVLDAYGWTLHLDTSELGGLKVTCRAKLPSTDRCAGLARPQARPGMKRGDDRA
jgi:signal transduction histidine kinase